MGCEAGWSKTSSPSSLEEKYLITVIFDMVIRKRGYIKVHRKKLGCHTQVWCVILHQVCEIYCSTYLKAHSQV